MAGEQLNTAEITEHGIAGDRIIQVRNSAGRIFSARTKPDLLRHQAELRPNGDVLVDGRPWNAKEVATDIEKAAGAGTRLVRSDADDRFDVLPLLVTTDGMFAAVGYDLALSPQPGHRRRRRAAERQWEGKQLRIGKVVIGMDDLRARCIMTTFDPDTGNRISTCCVKCKESSKAWWVSTATS